MWKPIKSTDLFRHFATLFFNSKHTAPLWEFQFDGSFQISLLVKGTLPPPSTNSKFPSFFFCSGRGTARSRNLAPIFGDGIKFHGAPINSFESHLDGRLNWMENGHTEPIETPEAELVAAARFSTFDVSDFFFFSLEIRLIFFFFCF